MTPESIAQDIIAHPHFDAFIRDQMFITGNIQDWQDFGVTPQNEFLVLQEMEKLNPCIEIGFGPFFTVFKNEDIQQDYHQMLADRKNVKPIHPYQ